MSEAATNVDMVVVGAGVVGMAVAHALLDDGRRVLVVDRGGVGEGASFGNAGAFAFSDVLPLASPGVMRKAPRWLVDPLGPLSIRPGYLPGIAPWLWRFWRASAPDAAHRSMLAQVDMMRLARRETARLLEASGLGAMLRSDGALELYESEAEFERSLPTWTARQREGIEFRHLRGAAIAELQPGLDARFSRATFVPGWQSIADPHAYVRALAEVATARGATIRQADAKAIEPADGRVAIRLADGGSISAAGAVIACGAWSKPLARRLGDPVPLDTERGYNTTLPASAFDLRLQLTFGGHGFVVTRLSSGIRVGGAVELGGLRAPANFARSEIMLAKAKRFLPALRTEGGRQWMGFRPSMPDSLPVIGRSSASPNVVYAFGHGHLGLTQSAATGRLVADLLADRPPPIDVSPFRPTRFRRGA